jgi:L-iditol 2-dehydrogenase
MKALLKLELGPGNLGVREMPEPEIRNATDVKIRVAAAGICGTDLSIEKGTHWCNAPVILGHEFGGTVVATGANVKGLKPGDRVVAETGQIICGNCVYCNTNSNLMCRERLSIGYGMNGAFAEYIVMREQIVHKIPDSVSFEEAALCEPAAVAVHAVFDKVGLLPTDVVTVRPGAIGLLTAQVAKSTGATVVVVGIDADQSRLQVARDLNMDYVVNSQQVDLKQFIAELTNGIGSDYVFECSGAVAAINSGISILKKKGTLVQVGLTAKRVEIEYSLLSQAEISLVGTFGHNWLCWERALNMIQKGKLQIKPLIYKTFALDCWEEAFKTAKDLSSLKVLFKPET